jgi:acetyl-CoA acyltransferase
MNERPGHAARADRVAVVDGVRTPFAKRATALREHDALDLAAHVVRALVERSRLENDDVGLVVFGHVVPSLSIVNLARELVFATGLSPRTDAFDVRRACATSLQATASAAQAILSGEHDVVIAGGADSLSDVPVGASEPLAKALIAAKQAPSLGAKLRALATLRAADLAPRIPDIRERVTGLSMGESAEAMARESGITRGAQDAWAVRSHARAAEAWASGLFEAEVVEIAGLARDNLVRDDVTLEALAALRPIFDRAHGTLTPGNSSALTDGASALLLMRESKARAMGLTPLGFVRSWGFAALDPRDGLLMGPAYATPIALDRAGVTLADIDVIELHEAFAAQVLCNLDAFASRSFAAEKLGRAAAIGEIDEAKLNLHGGSIALGHPFAATGARMVGTALRALGRRGGGLALVTACAAGGLGAALVLEGAG